MDVPGVLLGGVADHYNLDDFVEIQVKDVGG
jgi:hypothetical protein